jgi:MFS transporter, DHA2 family, multidrug resistance protein
VLLVLRALHGVFSGTLIPLLMMAALRFLPTPIRLHGLALYAMTATFAPNVGVWLAALCVDQLADWRWVYWSIIPPGLIAMALVYWGIPKMPLALPRARQANWLGMALGMCGLSLLVVALDQGVRLEWLHSPVIRASLLGGVALTALFLASEWIHPAPFMKLQLLQRRNLGLGFTIFFCLLVTMSTGVALPTNTLAHLQTFRMAQLAPLGLAIGLPQLLLGPAVALLLYQRWVDARYLFSLGLVCIALACWMAADITSEWMVSELVWMQVLQAIGQPMAVVSLLFLATSVVQPMEGPSVAGTVNTLRALGTIFSGALISQLMTVRGTFHADMLLDNAGQWLGSHGGDTSAISGLGSLVGEQASVLSTADIYRLFAVIAVLLIPLVLSLKYIPAPLTQPVTPAPQPGAAH